GPAVGPGRLRDTPPAIRRPAVARSLHSHRTHAVDDVRDVDGCRDAGQHQGAGHDAAAPGILLHVAPTSPWAARRRCGAARATAPSTRGLPGCPTPAR